MAEIDRVEEKVHVDEIVKERRGWCVNAESNGSGKTESGVSL